MTSAPRKTVLRGILLMVIAVLSVPVMDAFLKFLTANLPAIEVAFGRFVAQGLVATLLALFLRRVRELIPPRLPLHMLRGAFLAATAFFFISGLSYLPLPDCLAITFIEPLLLTAMSPILLGETIGWRRWTAAGVGFIGSLLVIQPSFETAGWVVLYPVAAAFSFCGYHVMTRKIAGEGSVMAAQWTTAMSGMLVLALVIVPLNVARVPGYELVMPGRTDLMFFVAIGIISYVAHGLIVRAFEYAPASVLAPYGYLEIVTATVLGYAVWGDLPSLLSWVGIALIIGSGIYSAHREMVRNREVKAIPLE